MPGARHGPGVPRTPSTCTAAAPDSLSAATVGACPVEAAAPFARRWLHAGVVPLPGRDLVQVARQPVSHDLVHDRQAHRHPPRLSPAAGAAPGDSFPAEAPGSRRTPVHSRQAYLDDPAHPFPGSVPLPFRAGTGDRHAPADWGWGTVTTQSRAGLARGLPRRIEAGARGRPGHPARSPHRRLFVAAGRSRGRGGRGRAWVDLARRPLRRQAVQVGVEAALAGLRGDKVQVLVNSRNGGVVPVWWELLASRCGSR